MQLWSHAFLNSRQVQGTLTFLLQSQSCVTRWHHIMHAPVSPAANQKSWVAQWTTQMVPWVVHNDFGLFDIKILKPKLYILITKNSDMDLAREILDSPVGPVVGNIWVARPFYGSHLATGRPLSCTTDALQATCYLHQSLVEIHNWDILNCLLICGFSQWALSVRYVGLVCQCLPGRFLADDTRFESIANFLTHERPQTDDVFQHF